MTVILRLICSTGPQLSTHIDAPWHRHVSVEGRPYSEHHRQRRNIPTERETNCMDT